jgi:tape measure domain-containing protein
MVDKLSPKLEQAVKEMEKLSKESKTAKGKMEELQEAGSGLEKTVRKLAAAFTMKELISSIATTRGEFQKLEVAFETMLGSAEQAKDLMAQLTNTAATTPFGLEDVANGAKQLLAYGTAADKVNETLIRLGDVAAGLSIPLNDLVYLYGTTMAQGRLYTQDLNQFTGRGIPMISELAKQFGVAESKVKELVESGKVGFPEVQKVIESLTDEGGKFGGLMEAQSHTISGQISNIEDAIEMMMNNIGQQSEGIINTTLSSVSYMIENYEHFGRILLSLAATYGVYRASLMTVVAAEGWATASEALHYNWLLLVEKAQKMLNATMLSNPYVLVATAIAGVVAAMVSMKTEAERLEDAESKYDAQLKKTIADEDELSKKMQEYCTIAANEALATTTRQEALNKLEHQYPKIFAKYDTEAEKLAHIKELKEKIAELDGQTSHKNTKNELSDVNSRIKALEAKTKQKIEYYQDGYGHQRSRYVTTSARTDEEETELKMLRNKSKQLTQKARKEDVDSYFSNLTGVSNDVLERQIKLRQDLLARMELSGKKYGKVSGNANTEGVYNADDLQYQLNKLNSEKNRRNEKKQSSADWVKENKEAHQKAIKEYNDFLDNPGNNMTKEEYEKKRKELKEKVDTTKKEDASPETDKDAEKAKKKAAAAEKEAEKRKQIEEKLGQELASIITDNEKEDIELMEDGIDKKLALIDNEYNERKNAIEKQKAEWERDNKKAGNGESLNEEQQAAIDEATRLNEEKRKKATEDAYKDEFAQMQEYLQKYGTFQQQKLAISTEYDDKIAKAGSAIEKQQLSKERDSKLANVEAANLQETIDWSVVFGEFGGMFKSIIEPELEKAKKYTQTDTFKNADQESQRTLLNAIEQMQKSVGGADKVSFKKLGTEVNNYQKNLKELEKAQDQYQKTYDALQQAQTNYTSAMISGTDADKEVAKVALESAQQQEEAASTNVEAMQKAVDTSNTVMTDVASRLKQSMEGVISGLQTLSSGSISGAYEGLITFGKSAKEMGGKLGDVFGKIADTLEDVPIIGWIVAIIDVFKDGLSTVVSGILDAVFDAVSGIIGDILSGDFFVSLFDSLKDGITNILDSITWGGFSSWFDSSNAKEVQETIEKLTDRNKDLQTSIEDLTDEISSSKGTKSVSAYRDAYEMQKETNQNYLDIAQAQAGYHNAHHSWNYYWEGYSQEQIDKLSKQIGRDWDGDIWNLSPEEMKVLRSNVDMWEQIKDTGKGGYGDSVADKLNDYIDQAGELEDLTEQLYEGLTGISFDSMYDSFIDNLMDMTYSAEDAADDISEYFMQAMLSNKIGELYSEKLEDWWNEFGKSMEDGELTEAERNSLSEEYMQYVDEALALRDELAKVTGYETSVSQSGNTGSFSALTQEQGTKLEGLFTNGLQHWSSMDEKMISIADKMSIAENHLSKIAENTGNTADILAEIRTAQKQMIRDGIKVK